MKLPKKGEWYYLPRMKKNDPVYYEVVLIQKDKTAALITFFIYRKFISRKHWKNDISFPSNFPPKYHLPMIKIRSQTLLAPSLKGHTIWDEVQPIKDQALIAGLMMKYGDVPYGEDLLTD
jgi:hypothetical protein